MSQFSKPKTGSNEGISAEAWYSTYMTNLDSADDKGETVDGIPVRSLCLVFENPKLIIDSNNKTRGYIGTNAVTAKPLGFYEIKSAVRQLDNLEPRRFVKEGHLIVPLFEVSGRNSLVVTREFAAYWINMGKYGVKHDDHHVASMYLYATQSIVWSICEEQEASRVKELAEMLVLVVKAAKAAFSHPQLTSFEIVEPLWHCDNAIDMLNRAISFIFNPEIWDKEAFLRMVEVSLKRWLKRSPQRDFVSEPIFGIIGIMVIVPILRDMSNGILTEHAASEKINRATMELMKTIADNLSERGKNLNEIIFHQLFQLGDFKEMSKNETDNFLEYCCNPQNSKRFMPLQLWGLVPAIEVPFDFENGNSTTISGRISEDKSKLKKKDNRWYLDSTNATNWTGARFGPGCYTVTPVTLAGTSQGKGNTAGKTRNAIVRFLTGSDLMPRKGQPVEAMSSAGVHYKNKGRKWDYHQTGNFLDLKIPFRITVRDNGSFQIHQNGKIWHQQKHEPGTMITIAYKFVRFEFTFQPDDIQPPCYEDVVQEEKKDDGDDGGCLNGLTGIALMKKLAEMSEK